MNYDWHKWSKTSMRELLIVIAFLFHLSNICCWTFFSFLLHRLLRLLCCLAHLTVCWWCRYVFIGWISNENGICCVHVKLVIARSLWIVLNLFWVNFEEYNFWIYLIKFRGTKLLHWGVCNLRFEGYAAYSTRVTPFMFQGKFPNLEDATYRSRGTQLSDQGVCNLWIKGYATYELKGKKLID
jgi:hypothetical protein